MLRCHEEKSKILNALDFPMLSAPHPPTSIASDLAAFNATVDLPMCGHNILFPVASTRWGLAATAGAHHLWHIDCNSLCTYIDTNWPKLLHGLSRALLISPIPPFIQKTFILTVPTWTSGILKQSFYSLDLDCELSPLMQIENVAQCGIES